jgi:hypothetical protein
MNVTVPLGSSAIRRSYAESPRPVKGIRPSSLFREDEHRLPRKSPAALRHPLSTEAALRTVAIDASATTETDDVHQRGSISRRHLLLRPGEAGVRGGPCRALGARPRRAWPKAKCARSLPYECRRRLLRRSGVTVSLTRWFPILARRVPGRARRCSHLRLKNPPRQCANTRPRAGARWPRMSG